MQKAAFNHENSGHHDLLSFLQSGTPDPLKNVTDILQITLANFLITPDKYANILNPIL